ncbi:MAG: CDP-diacylglycerol--serine O-phosphatidyltransferase [bacterium]|nr:CDP-diacylglycerol--serine O-phosphatidyltransferase [bacterium]
MNIPTLFTFLNLFSGFMAIIAISEMKMESALWFIVFSAIFDFIDGKMARLFKTNSKLGPQVDSLADAVSFGVAPSFFIYSFVVFPLGKFTPFSLLPFVYLSAVVMRLARFNVIGEDSQKEFYYGLSSPISALFLISFISSLHRFFPSFLFEKEVTAGMVLILSLLMLSKIEFPVFKKTKKAEKIQIVFFITGLLLLVYFKYLFLFVAILFYIIGGIIRYLLTREDDE